MDVVEVRVVFATHGASGDAKMNWELLPFLEGHTVYLMGLEPLRPELWNVEKWMLCP